MLEGTQGIGVVLAETRKAAESVIEAFRGLKANILVQEFIKEAHGSDIRCFVIGGKVVATMMRQGGDGEFRSNIHRGGKATTIQITPEERSTAVRAAKSWQGGRRRHAAFKPRPGCHGDPSPGLEGIEKTTGKDVAAKVYEFIEKNAKPGKTRTGLRR